MNRRQYLFLINFTISGTICAGFSSFCCSRNEDIDGAGRFVSCLIGWGIGCAQMLLFLLCLVGWFWSCAWGIFFIGMSGKFESLPENKSLGQSKLKALYRQQKMYFYMLLKATYIGVIFSSILLYIHQSLCLSVCMSFSCKCNSSHIYCLIFRVIFSSWEYSIHLFWHIVLCSRMLLWNRQKEYFSTVTLF